MLDVARRMSEASRTRFTYGVAYQINQYTADGTIFDYMAGDRLVRMNTFPVFCDVCSDTRLLVEPALVIGQKYFFILLVFVQLKFCIDIWQYRSGSPVALCWS